MMGSSVLTSLISCCNQLTADKKTTVKTLPGLQRQAKIILPKYSLLLFVDYGDDYGYNVI